MHDTTSRSNSPLFSHKLKKKKKEAGWNTKILFYFNNEKREYSTYLCFFRRNAGQFPIGQGQLEPGEHPRDLVTGSFVQNLMENGDLSCPEEHARCTEPECLGGNLC